MESGLKEKWQQLMDVLEKEVTPISYNTWFLPLKPIRIDEGTNIIYIEAYNPFIIKVFKERYIQLLKNNIKNVFLADYEVVFQLPDEQDPKVEKKENKTATVKDEDFNSEFYFNPRYNFESFVVGNNNRFAHAAALAVAESPSEAYNPLFLYGGSGLGKTHLMHAIGCHILKNSNNLKVLYVSSEMFANELIDAVRDNNKTKKMAFKEKYREIDVLLIDDIQFIEGKEATQEEFFHTFNTLYDMNKQIVISSDRAPNKLINLDERLRSRFAWNLIADIQPPDYETRVAILQRKAEVENIVIDEGVSDVINLIAEKIKFNIRELEGAFLRINSFSQLLNEKIDLKFAKTVLKDVISTDSTVTPDLIKRNVSSHFKIKISDLESSKRVRSIAFPRQIAMYLCREMTDLSFPKIGEYFGGRDHTTVLHAHDKIEDEIKSNEETKELVETIMNKINML